VYACTHHRVNTLLPRNAKLRQDFSENLIFLGSDALAHSSQQTEVKWHSLPRNLRFYRRKLEAGERFFIRLRSMPSTVFAVPSARSRQSQPATSKSLSSRSSAPLVTELAMTTKSAKARERIRAAVGDAPVSRTQAQSVKANLFEH
jgi:hypothetical protein